MKLSNYSLSYASLFREGRLDLFGFLTICRELDVDGASLHMDAIPDRGKDYLTRVRRAFLDSGLSISMLAVSTDFGVPEDRQAAELDRTREAIRTAAFIGAPILRVFPGMPPAEAERRQAFERAAAGVRRACAEAADFGLPVGLQNHNHGALCRTGREVIEFMRMVDHPNLVFVLDTGQFAGSLGASGPPEAYRDFDYLASIRETASIARYVRAKFYNPRPDGSEPWLDYDAILDILRGVHYQGFVDIVFEPGTRNTPPQDARTAIPRAARYLRSRLQPSGGVPAAARDPATARYEGLRTAEHFDAVGLRTETTVAFLEGPAVDRAGAVYFSDIPAERIMKWDPATSKLTVFREPSNQANGLLFDGEGRLIACEGGGRVTRTDMKSREVTLLADQYGGKPLGSPNDLAIDALGRIYFTSRLDNLDPEKGNVNSVYRIDAPGRVERILHSPDIDMPNGIVTSPDDKTLYLIDADGREGRARRIRAYELKPNGTVGQERLLHDFYPGRSGDGMCIDQAGNLYVAAGLHRPRSSSETLDTRPGIHVISPEGKLLAFVETPEDTITNCRFGGEDLRTLYITCGKLLLSLRTRIPGKASYRPGG